MISLHKLCFWLTENEIPVCYKYRSFKGVLGKSRCSENHRGHTNTLDGENIGCLNVKAGGVSSYHSASNG